MISNYEARIEALQDIQYAIRKLQGIVVKNELINKTILLLKTSRKNIIEEMREG